MARLPEVVVDASVVCKWFVPETGSDRALALRDAHAEGRIRIIAPDVLCYEFANALRHHPGMSAHRLRAEVRFFFDLQVGLVPPSSAILGLASELAFREKLTIYDAVYAILAEAHSCSLVTEDSRLLRASDRAVPISGWSLDH